MFYDIMSWIGMILVLVSYILLSPNKLKNGVLYQILNLIAWIFMAIGLYPKNVCFSLALQIIWSLVTSIKKWRERRNI